MRALLLLTMLLIAFWGTAAQAASTTYSLALQGETVRGTMDLSIETEKPVNVISASVLLPEGAFVSRVEDSFGEITEFEVSNGLLAFKTHSSVPKKREAVRITLDIPGVFDDTYAPARFLDLSLPAFPESDTHLALQARHMRAFEGTHGFSGGIQGDTLSLQGRGPLSVRVLVVEEGQAVGSFWVVNDSSRSFEELMENGLRDAERLFPLVPAVLGVLPPFEHFVVLVLDEEKYNALANAYSQGLYRTGGIILVRASVFEEEGAAKVILHESVHVVNAHVLSFNQANAAWFDEGTAKFVEYLAEQQLGVHSANLFFGEVQYTEGNTLYTKFPKGDIEDLEEYYAENKTFMNAWHPEIPQTRDFGYAFSELFVRDYVQRYGLSVFRERYRDFLDTENVIEDGAEFTARVEGVMGETAAPCKSSSTKDIRDCVAEANEFLPVIPGTVDVLVLGGSSTVPDDSIGDVKDYTRTLRVETAQTFLKEAASALQEIFLSLGRVLSSLQSTG